jgi:hypothetical protein
MELAVYCLTFAPAAAGLLDPLRAVLAEQGDPVISMNRDEDLLIFRCPTGQFMLRARVSDALATVSDHDTWQRLFQPLP